jgi:FixJ family two-component response regulator
MFPQRLPGAVLMPAKKPIHIVDDDVGFLKGIERLLSTHGLPVKSFSSAEEFRARDAEDACCVILDIHLGRISGIDLMRELFRSGSTTPVILITANDSEHVRHAAMEAGCSAYLQKPVSGRILLDAVQQVVGTAIKLR